MLVTSTNIGTGQVEQIIFTLLVIPLGVQPWKKQMKSNLMPFKLFALQATSYRATYHTRMHVCHKFGPEMKSPLTFVLQIGEDTSISLSLLLY